MKSTTRMITLIVILVTVSGCSKFRELTRRDYALLKDPFLDRSAVAELDKDEEESNDKTSTKVVSKGTSGVVHVADLSAGPKNEASVRTASQTAAPKNDFNGIRVRGMGDAIATEFGPSAKDVAGKPSEQKIASSAEPSSEKPVDMAGFAEFVRNEATASGMTETAKELDKDMTDLFVQQREEWKRQAEELDEKASPLINSVQQVSQTRTTEPPPEMPTLPKLGYGSTSTEVEEATPFIRGNTRTAATSSWVVPTPTTETKAEPLIAPATPNPDFSSDPFADNNASSSPFASPSGTNATAAAPATAPASSNPFAAASESATPAPVFDEPATEEQWNPFRGFDSATSNATASAPKPKFAQPFPKPSSAGTSSSDKPIDSEFSFDSGWRPSNLQQ